MMLNETIQPISGFLTFEVGGDGGKPGELKLVRFVGRFWSTGETGGWGEEGDGGGEGDKDGGIDGDGGESGGGVDGGDVFPVSRIGPTKPPGVGGGGLEVGGGGLEICGNCLTSVSGAVFETTLNPTELLKVVLQLPHNTISSKSVLTSFATTIVGEMISVETTSDAELILVITTLSKLTLSNCAIPCL